MPLIIADTQFVNGSKRQVVFWPKEQKAYFIPLKRKNCLLSPWERELFILIDSPPVARGAVWSHSCHLVAFVFICVRADIVGVMAFLPLNELPALFPHVVDWISSLEKQAQESGRTLNPIEFNLAQTVGVAHPEGVRILSIPRIPLPAHPRVKQLARRVGLLNANTGGLTAVYGVIVRRHCE